MKFLLIVLFYSISAFAGPLMEVTVDQSEIGQDETFSLRFSFRADGELDLSGPDYDAPDFDLVNQYEGQFIESFYENGRFGMRNNRTVTKVFRPKKTGNLSITQIRAKVNGTVVKSNDIVITVSPGGGGTPPPQNYGGAGMGLRGVKKRTGAAGFLMRAEVDKQKLVKGEQLIVSYYLYRRVRVINLGVDKFPVLSGFLREDLELPVVGQKLDIEAVTLDGVAYHRSLLARYAAYPLKEGKLPIDPMAVKVNYFGAESGLDSEDDPMFNFFRQANPLVGTAQSDPITVEVSPLPPGQPDNFTGGIGDFQIAASVDKLSVKANDALTLTIRVDGRGSTRAIELPQTQWPPGVQLFDSKGTVKSNRGGSSEKIFENILIPRQPGTVLIPPIHLSFYDPVKKEYVTRSTTAISINVGPASGNSLSNAAASPAPATLTGSASTSTSSVQPAFHGLKTSDLGTPKKSDWFVKLSGLAVACIVLVGVALGVAFILRSNGGLSQSQTKRVDSWKQVADLPTGTRDQLVTAYDRLSMAIYDSIDQAFSIGARSLPRGELQRILVQDGKVSQQQWDNISALLEYSETVRYALSVGAISEQVARQDFSRKSEEAREILKKIAVISS